MFYLKNTQRVFLLLLLFFSGLSLTQAATITVTNNNDGGSGSLRNAINSAVNGDQIVFASGITTVNLTSGEIAFGKSITINGGTSGVTINRQVGSFRLFNISSGSVTFTRINLTNGNSTDGNGGGAIAGNSSVTLTMTNCNITGNNSNGGGAAVVVSGPTTFTNCNFSNNTTTNTVGHCILLYPPGTLSMNGCTVSNNTGNVGGAAVDIRGGGGGNTTVNLTNCTISGNNRAGLITPNFECTISIINVTITDNAIGFENYTDKCTMKNSIVAGNNFDVADSGPVFTSGSTNNILGNDGNSGLINGVNGNQIGADPKLLALASNGGFTQTHALSPCSPAINAGTSSGAPSTDQRGNSRFGTVDIGSYELQSAPSSFTVNTTPTNPSCGGQNNGSISVTITGGGASPFTYAWSGSGIGLNPRTGLAPGTYTVTVTDNAGCTGTRSTTLTTASGPTVTSTGTNVSCNGGNNGAINLNVSGGAAPYTYAWTGTGTGTNPRTGLTAGTYTVTVTDDGGCTATRSTTLTAPAAISISAATTNVTCNGAGNGSINLTVTGGTGGYTYAWSGTGTGTDPRTNLGPGTYTVTVTDANMCTRTSSATITEPAVLVVTPSATNANCGSSTGSITLNVSGGTPTYTYAWTGTGSGTNPRTGLAAGTYTVTVTDTQGCTRTASATLTSVDNTPPTITCPPTQAVSASSNCTAMLLNYPSLANVSDNCGVPVVTQSPAGATTLSLGANTVTLTATDASNNSASCTFTVNVNDVTPPTLACPSNATVSASGSCTAVLINYTSAATATDNCTTNLVKTQSPASGTIIVLGPNIITLSTTDNAGNNRTCTMTVTVRDVSAPFITNCPANTTVNANANGNYTMPNVANGVGVSDNCGGVPTRAQNPTAGTILTVGTTTVTISATDAAGNTASCSYSLTVNPGCTAPVITCPTNKTIAAGANCTAPLPSYVTQATVTNGCGLTTVTQSPAVGTTLSQGAHVVTLIATDANGSSSTCTFSVTVADQTAPTVTCPANTTVAAGANCSGTLGAYSASATDNCTTSPTATQSPAAGTTFTGSQVVTFTATDAAGNSGTCSFTVSANDQTAPTITCPANTTVAAGANCSATLASYTAAATAMDNCTASPTKMQSPAAGTSFTGAQVVTLTATDAAGNTATCSFQVSVMDQTAPSITCPGNSFISGNQNCQATISNLTGVATVNDNCTVNPTVVQNPPVGTVFSGSQIITLTASDAVGNSSTCSFNLMIVDQTAPSITCPANTTVAAGANCAASLASYTAAATASDNCTLNPTKTQSPAAGTTFTGSQVVTLTATDAAGNTAICSFLVTVADQTAPSITCPANTTVAAGANCSATLANYAASVTATDNCSANPNETQSPAAGTTFTGSQVVTLTATDAAGNTATCSFLVTVADQTAPSISCPANTTVAAGANCSATLANYAASVTATDNCAANPNETQSPAVGTTFTGSQVVTLTATDAAGNTATCSFLVTVADQTAPSISCPANTTVAAGANCSATLANYAATVTATDNCSANPNETQSPAAGTTFTGSQVVTLTANDAAGNTATCSFLVTVADQTAPSISCPANTTVAAGANCSATLANYAASVTATDNCAANPNETQSPAAGTTITGSQVVTLTATDAAGNTATCSFLVTVADQTAPSITCPANTTVAAGANCSATLANYAASVTATDNCAANPNEMQSPVVGTTFTGSQVVTLIATDAAGNSATCSFLVTVADQTAPSISCPANTTVAAGANCTATLANYAASVTATDNCSANPNETQSPAAGTTITGSQVVTLTATDAAGNSATCSFLVTLADQTAPSITCPANTTVAAGANCTASLANYAASVTATDNCSANPNETQSPAAGTNISGTQLVTLTATDAAGNTAICSFIVTVTDQTAPSFACPANTTVAAGANCNATLANYAASVSATDNCSANPNETQSPAAGTTITGSQVVTLTATDAAGNSATCSFLVTVADQTAPSISCPANTTVAAGANCSATLANYAASVSATDNCSANPNETQSPSAGTTISGTQLVTLTATDAAGNTANCSFSVTLVDQIAPSITCPANTTVAAGANCTTTLANYAATVSATDNCTANPNETQSPAAGTTISGTQTVTLTATDAAGNTATCSFLVTVTDQTAPSISCPANTTVAAGANCSATLANYAASVSATDNCSANPNETQSPSVGTTISGTQLVTLTATDAAGNTANCSFSVTLVDQTAPGITCPANTTVAAGANCTATLANYAATVSATDNCTANPNETQSPAAGTTISGTQTVTLTATDAAGNSAICSFAVTVVDQTAPSISCPANTTVAVAGVNCNATLGNYAASVSATDNCTANPNESQSPVSGTTISGVQVVTLTATDAAGNTSTCSFNVTAIDQTAPTVTCKPLVTTLGANGTVTVTTADVFQSGSDNCSVVNQVSVTPSTLTCANIGLTTVVLTVSDNSGNTATCSATVKLSDNLAPTVVCKNFTTSLNGTGTATITPANVYQSGTDNCGTVAPISVTPATFNCSNLGNNVVTLTAIDGSGNQATCSAIVTVTDPIAPVALCKNAIVSIPNTGSASVTTTMINNGTTDNCSFTLAVSPATFTCAQLGLNTVVLTATDASGNTATCSATVTVRDLTGPVAICKNATIFLNATGEATLNPSQVDNGSFDACGIASMTVSDALFNCSDIGTPIAVFLRVRDINGNLSTCTSYVTVRDNTAPTASCEDVQVTLGANGKVAVYGASLAAGSTDNCGVWSYTPIAKVYTTANIGVNYLTITVKDWSGNAATCVSEVTVFPNDNLGGNGNGTQSVNDEEEDLEIEIEMLESEIAEELTNLQPSGNLMELDNTKIEVSIYPNPTMHDAFVEFQLPNKSDYRVVLLDATGRLAYLSNGFGAEGYNRLVLPMSELPSGVYFMELRAGALVTRKQLIRQE